LACLAAALLTAPAAFSQKPATFTPNSLPPFQSFGRTVSLSITSPYDDCTMAISVSVTPAGFVTVAPPGPVIGLGPFNFTVTSGPRNGTGTITFLISGDPGNCVNPTTYTIPVSINVPGTSTPPPGSSHEKQVIEPVSMANGSLTNTFEDLRLRGPLPIYFERYYYSRLASEGQVTSALGTNWMHNYDLKLRITGTTATVVYYFGQAIQFTSSGTTWTQSTNDEIRFQLLQSGTTYQMLDPSSQLVYMFDAITGQLKTIQDRNGNTQTLTYANGLLSRVADGLGGTLDFAYISGNLTKVTDHSGRSVGFSFSGGVPTTFVDAGGKATLYSYTAGGLMTSMTLPRSNAPYTTAYDNNNRVATQKDAAGNTFTFNFNTTAGTSTMTDPLSGNSNYAHNSRRDLTSETDPLNNSTQSTYDTNDRLLSQRDASGHTTSFTYNASNGLVAATTYADGSQQVYTYTTSTANGFTYYDITGVTYPDGGTETFQFDANGNIVSRTDRNGQIWKTTYESHGLPLVRTDPNGATTIYTYSTDGLLNLVSIQFPNTSAITYTMDSLKRMITKKRSDGTSAGYTYDAYDHLLTSTDETGGVTTYTYDLNGNLAGIKDQTGGVTSFTRTGTDKIAGVTDAAGRTLTPKYDALDRPGSLTFGDGSSYQLGYDAAGNQTSYTDGEGKVWKMGYSSTNVMNSLTTPLGGKTSVTLDVLDRVSQISTPAGRNTAIAYDKMGRITGITDPLQKATTYTYDKNGNLNSATAPGAIAATYGRDNMGFLSSIRDAAGNQWGFTYDGQGRQLSVTDPLNQTQTFTRDARGRISSVKLPLGTYSTTLDGVGRVTNGKYSDGTSIDYTYDAAGRLLSATGLTFAYDSTGALTGSNGLSLTSDKLGRVSQITLAAGKTITYTYDRRGLVTQVNDWLTGATTFKYDDNGRVTSITRPNGVITAYTYDADGLVASIQDAKSATLSSIALTRDQRGLVTQANRTVPINPTADQLSSVQSFHTYDAAGQIVEFKYDAMGRRTSDDTNTYTWDLASRLASYSGGSDNGTVTSNGLGMVASQTKGGVTQTFVWNFGLGLPSISVIRGASGDLAYYVHTPGGQLLHSVDANGARRFYHFDEMGNTIFLTDDSGAITDKYAYTEYGALLTPSGGSSNPFLFAGRDGILQLGAGLYSMRARIYDSRTGVFLSRDPNMQSAPLTTNPYAYAANNPLQFNNVTGGDPNTGNGPQVIYVPVYIYVPVPTGSTGGPASGLPILPNTGFTGVTGPMVTNLPGIVPLPDFSTGTGAAGPLNGGNGITINLPPIFSTTPSGLTGQSPSPPITLPPSVLPPINPLAPLTVPPSNGGNAYSPSAPPRPSGVGAGGGSPGPEPRRRYRHAPGRPSDAVQGYR
jgi:RHS repeat-associated protein